MKTTTNQEIKRSKFCLDPTLSNIVVLETVIPAVIALEQAFFAVTQLLFADLLWAVSGLGLGFFANEPDNNGNKYSQHEFKFVESWNVTL